MKQGKTEKAVFAKLSKVELGKDKKVELAIGDTLSKMSL